MWKCTWGGLLSDTSKIVVKFTIFEVGAWIFRELLLYLHHNNPFFSIVGGINRK